MLAYGCRSAFRGFNLFTAFIGTFSLSKCTFVHGMKDQEWYRQKPSAISLFLLKTCKLMLLQFLAYLKYFILSHRFRPLSLSPHKPTSTVFPLPAPHLLIPLTGICRNCFFTDFAQLRGKTSVSLSEGWRGWRRSGAESFRTQLICLSLLPFNGSSRCVKWSTEV